MSVYLGSLGRLVELKCPSGQSVSVDDGFSFESTLEGRVKAQAKTARPRQWSVDVSAATPADLANLLAFAGGEWGNGPFVWVSADAPVTNLLTPGVSLSGPSAVSAATTMAAGPMAMGPNEWAGRSLMTSAPSVRTTIGSIQTPVLPGLPVTGSVWAVGAGATVGIHWYSATGVAVGAAGSTITGGSALPRRLHITATPPAAAASCILSVMGATQWARPAITWTSEPFDWQPGEGCPKAVPHGLNRKVILALRDPTYGRYSDASFTVTEVG